MKMYKQKQVSGRKVEQHGRKVIYGNREKDMGVEMYREIGG